MSTTNEVIEHLKALRDAIGIQLNTAREYDDLNADLTAGGHNKYLEAVRTIPATALHPSDCLICTGWRVDI